jgi:hypothetical protein
VQRVLLLLISLLLAVAVAEVNTIQVVVALVVINPVQHL